MLSSFHFGQTAGSERTHEKWRFRSGHDCGFKRPGSHCNRHRQAQPVPADWQSGPDGRHYRPGKAGGHAQEHRQKNWNRNPWPRQRVHSKSANGTGPRGPGLFCPSTFPLGETHGGEHKRPTPAVYSQAPFLGRCLRSWSWHFLCFAQSQAPQMPWLAHSLWGLLSKSVALHLAIRHTKQFTVLCKWSSFFLLYMSSITR